MMPPIKEKFPETTLQIFTEISKVPPELLDQIKKTDYIYISPRTTQENIALEFLKSDVWLYPTNFSETYCITALEAMCAGCLVACTSVAGLQDTVGDRGVMASQGKTDELLKKLLFVMERGELKEHYIKKAREWAIKQTYESLAGEWNEIFRRLHLTKL